MDEEHRMWFSVSLRLSGDGFDPELVEAQLGLKPKYLRLKGQRIIDKSGRECPPWSNHFWCHQVASDSEVGLEEQILVLFDRLGDRKEQLRELCSREGVRADLFCGIGSTNGMGGDILRPSTLRLLADAGLSLSLDLYPPKLGS